MATEAIPNKKECVDLTVNQLADRPLRISKGKEKVENNQGRRIISTLAIIGNSHIHHLSYIGATSLIGNDGTIEYYQCHGLRENLVQELWYGRI